MTKKNSKAWMEDGDDAHFDGNPAFKKNSIHNRKKVGKSHAAVKGKSSAKKVVGGLATPKLAAKKPVKHKKSAHKKRVAGK